MNQPKITLIHHTSNPEQTIQFAARVCASSKPINDLLNEPAEGGFLKKLHSLGHLSPFEHVSFTFAVEGISRACSHQLVRHRVGTAFSQRSQRYTFSPKDVRFPQTITPWRHHLHKSVDLYKEAIEAGVSREDARYLLPQAITTTLIATFNARALLHFFALRACRQAQREIQELARQMFESVYAIAPNLFALAGPPCKTCENDACRGVPRSEFEGSWS